MIGVDSSSHFLPRDATLARYVPSFTPDALCCGGAGRTVPHETVSRRIRDARKRAARRRNAVQHIPCEWTLCPFQRLPKIRVTLQDTAAFFPNALCNLT